MTERRAYLLRAVPRTRHLLILPLVLALGVFLALGAYQLSLPGLHYDEAREAGLNAAELIGGQPVTAFRDAVIQVGPWQLPLMVQDYIGALNVYLVLPFLLAGGINVVALRWLSLLTGALTLVLAWRIADRLGGSVAAIVTVILLAVSPTFVFWSRQGIFVTNLTALLFMAGLLSGLRWWSGRRARDLWLTAFLLGVGIYAKLLFVWAVGALIIVALVGQQVSRMGRRVPPAAGQNGGRGSGDLRGDGARDGVRTSARTWIVAVVCFLVPLTPLILFNLRTWGTLDSIFGNLGQSYYGVKNAAYLSNLLVRLRQLGTLLRGDHFWYLGELFANRWAPWLAAGLVFVASVQAVVVWRRRSRPESTDVSYGDVSDGRPYAFLIPLALLLLIVVQSAFTVSDLFITHFALPYPLISLTGGLAVVALTQRSHRSGDLAGQRGGRAEEQRIGRVSGFKYSSMAVIALLGVTCWAAGDLWTSVRYHDVLSISGGYSAHSDAVYRLAERLDRDGFAAPIALDWGLAAPLQFLTAGRVVPIEVFGYDRMGAPDAGFAERISRFLDDPNSLYLAHMPDVTVFGGRVDALKALAEERGLALEEAGRFAERSGHPLYVLYRTVPVAGD